MKKQIIVTNDNSHTILIPELDETYHSRHGAIQEAEHVFIKNGLENLSELKFVKVFEMGFGTGLNALLTLEWATRHNLMIEYTALEKYPLNESLLLKINYKSMCSSDKNYAKIHQASWNKKEQIAPQFRLYKIEADIQEFKAAPEEFDLIYFDAFGPKTQPKLWSLSIMQKMYDCLKENGNLITYCAQGQFKRNLKEVGFTVKALPGPPGKREITRAVK